MRFRAANTWYNFDEVIELRNFTIRKTISFMIAVMLMTVLFATAVAQEDTAEPVYVQDYYDGTVLDLTQYEGKVVMINYFTEWCPYCMEEMPDIATALQMYDPESLVIILVHPWDGEDETNSASVIATYGVDEAVMVEDTDFALVNAIGVPGYPTSVFIDQEGYLYYAVASMIDLDLLTTIFDDLGVPLRTDGAEEEAEATPAP